MKVKIAVAQLEINQFNPIANISKAEVFIHKASETKADIIVFPEDFVTGPILGKKEYVDSSRKYVSIFQTFAKRYHIAIVPGSFIEDDTTGLFNTTYYIDVSGKIKGRYQKVNLWLPERKYLTPGNNISVFNTKFGKVGLIICWDLIFPEIFRKMAKKGVNIVICPSYWSIEDAGIGLRYDKEAEVKSVNALCIARAFENEIILVYANAAGRLQVNTICDELIGQSQITVPFKGTIQRIEHNKEKMFIQGIDTDILKDAEKAYKIHEDLKKRILY